MQIESRLVALGIALPEAPAAVAAYVSWTRTGNLVVTSGQLPWVGDKLAYTGRLGAELDEAQGYEAARVCAINGISQLKAAVGDLDRVVRIVRLEGNVHAAPGFRGHPKVLNGASNLLNEVFGDRGHHTRTALGVNEMPLNAAIQLSLWVEVSDEPAAPRAKDDTTIAHLTLATRDVRRSAQFFERTLGWKPIERPGNLERKAAWLAISPDQELHLLEVSDFVPSAFEREFGRHCAIKFPLREFESLKSRLVREGAELITPARETPFERFFFRDPNGYVFEIVE